MMPKKNVASRSEKLKRFALLMLHQAADLCIIASLLWGLSLSYGVEFESYYWDLVIITCIIVPIGFAASRTYAATVSPTYVATEFEPEAQLVRLFQGWGLVVMVLILLGFLTKTTALFSRLLLGTWFVLVPFVIRCAHVGLNLILQRLGICKGNQRRAVIAGTGPMAVRLHHKLTANRAMGVDVRGFFTQTLDSTHGKFEQQPLFGTFEQLPDYVRQKHIDIVYITPTQEGTESAVQALIADLQDTTAAVYRLCSIFAVDPRQVRVMDGMVLVAEQESPVSGLKAALKRTIDVVLSIVILILVSPVMVAVAIAVKLSSPGPILFKQRRSGLNDQNIMVYKFRSMNVTENGPQIKQAQVNDPRVTPVGAFIRRTSLDELPQFFNVLQGHMSIVGPRPHAIAHNELYRDQIQEYRRRHMMKPGITGWAQVHGFRGETETIEKMKKRIEYDLEYLNNWSIWLDFKIILRTIFVLLNQQNAY